MSRHKLGTWTCPSGNTVDVYLEADDGDGMRHISLEWDRELATADHLFYVGVILPDLTRRAQEYLERPGRALAVIL